MQNKAHSSNPNLDYSSDSSFDDYYLSYENERMPKIVTDHILVAACEEGDMPWDSDPVKMSNFLKEVNGKYGWKLPTDIDYIKKRLKTDKRIKKMSSLYQKQHSQEENRKGKSVKRRRNCSTSSLSTLETSTSYYSQAAQISNTAMNNIDENPIQEMAAVVANQEASEKGRERPVLFIRRELNKTDIDKHQNRLSMPCSQVNDSLLTREERERLKDSTVAAKLIDPENRVYDISLKLTKAGVSTCSYAIGKPWNEIKKDNGFRTGTVLDVRGFRGERGQLCFLLERVG